MNDSTSAVLVKPFVVMAARVLGPGPTRLRLVKLAHNLGYNGVMIEVPKRASHDAAQGSAHTPRAA